MIKPISYHSIEEKEALEKKLMADIPNEKRLRASKALMKIFSRQKKKEGMYDTQFTSGSMRALRGRRVPTSSD